MTRLPAATTAIAAAVLLAACGGPSTPTLTDPTAILQAAATQAAAASSVHIDLTADGDLSLDVTGLGAGAPVQLTGSTASVDVDLRGGDARATFALPGILGLRGELIVVDGTGYLKSTLTGPDYREIPLGSALPGANGASPGASTDSASMLASLATFLARPELAPVKGEDVDCGGTTCYSVTVNLTPDELAALAAEGGGPSALGGLPIPLPDVSTTSVDLTAHVEHDSTRLAGLTAVVKGTDASAPLDATVELTFSKWDESVTVTAPPADQVSSGG